MKNLKELLERYPKGLGTLMLGGHPLYEINSDVPCQLNGFGGGDYVLNEDGRVELFSIDVSPENRWTYYLNGEEISEEEWNTAEEQLGWEEAKEAGYTYDDNAITTWWGLTLDKYYLHPYYPEREIKGFEIIQHIPFFNKGEVYEFDTSYLTFMYSVDNCFDYPEFFKPVY